MSNTETVSLASLSPKSTFNTGFSLAASLYLSKQTLYLRGELGTGKTTFVQGLGLGLGISEPIVSPTYALENRYGGTLLHMDLFRIDPQEARTLLEASEDFPGVRVVEWSERVDEDYGLGTRDKGLAIGAKNETPSPKSLVLSPMITVTFTDISPTSRTITVIFADLPLPDFGSIEEWRNEVKTPEHIRKHCDAVGTFAEHCAEALLRRGTIARPQALKIAGCLHDLLRFIDFLNTEDRKKHPEWMMASGGNRL